MFVVCFFAMLTHNVMAAMCFQTPPTNYKLNPVFIVCLPNWITFPFGSPSYLGRIAILVTFLSLSLGHILWVTLCGSNCVSHIKLFIFCGSHYVGHSLWVSLCGPQFVGHIVFVYVVCVPNMTIMHHIWPI